MITTAAFLLGTAYECCHNDDYSAEDAGWGPLIMLVVFMWFDYSMVELLVNAL